LMQMYSFNTNNTQVYRVLKSSADSIWNLARNTTSTLFSVNWAGPVQTNADQGQMNAACMALSRFAQQYGSYTSSASTNVYEAENATLHNLGVEAIYGSFSGWGYVASWNAQGQAVDFKIPCPSAGRYLLTFRYAAGAGLASRLVSINGANTFRNQSFPGTADWSSYNSVVLSTNLPGGTNTISVAFNTALGSANYLNLDSLTVVPEQIVFSSIDFSAPGIIRLVWSSFPGHVYQLQFSHASPDGPWTSLGTPITAVTNTVTVTDSVVAGAGRFYRVQLY